MAFKKTLNSILKKYKGFYKNKKKTTVFLTIAGAGLLIYGSLILFETLQFKFAERKINSVYSQMLEEFPGSEDSSVGGSCAYRSYKFSKGRPVCGYGFSVRFLKPDINDASMLANQFDALIGSQNKFGVKSKYPDSGEIDLFKIKRGDESIRSYTFDGNIGMRCYGGIDHFSSLDPFVTSSALRDRKYVSVSIRCVKDSFIEHYPISGE